MKFSEGCWMNKPGYTVKYAQQPYAIEVRNNAVYVLATAYVGRDRADTIQGPNFEIVFSSQAKNVIKVSITHFAGEASGEPKFELNEDQGFVPVIHQTKEYTELISGDTKVVITDGPLWEIGYYYKDRYLTGNGWRSTSYITQEKHLQQVYEQRNADNYFFQYPEGTSGAYIREQLSGGVGECIYGFGEKFTPFVKNGQTVDIWNSDGGTSTEQSYKSIPFYLSSNSYGVLVNSTDRVSYEVMSDTVSAVSFTVPGEKLEYFVIGGKNLEDVMVSYTALTGKPALPPAYSFGLWLSTSFTTNYDEKTVTSFIDGMEQRDIPLQVFHFDCFWMKEFELCGFEWDERQFPEPVQMLKRLHEKGVEICVWINPYVAQRTRLFEEGKKNGYFIRRKDGSVFQTDFWQPGMAIVDFTNPRAWEWFKGLLKELFDAGVNNIKTDFGERIPWDCQYADGSDPIKMHNYYTYLYNKCVFEALEDYYGKNRACLFSRSATVGGQKFPVHWGGDCFGAYVNMAETLRGGLSLCSSGFGFFSHDIGGFEAKSSEDIYKRWCAFGLMSTHSRLHGSNSYRVPWQYGEEACDVLRFYTKLKGKLMPYLWAQAVKTHETGIPMMRSMIMSFTDDPVCRYLDRQYLLGDNLLIVPVMSRDGNVQFYLPEGKWEDINSGRVYEGGKYYSEICNYFEMPILARPASIITFGNFDRNFVYDYLADGLVVIYHLEDGETAFASIYDSEAEKITDITAVRAADTIRVSYQAVDRDFTIEVAGTGLRQTVHAGSTETVFAL